MHVTTIMAKDTIDLKEHEEGYMSMFTGKKYMVIMKLHYNL